MKKSLSVLLAIIMLASVFYSTNLYAGAAGMTTNVSFNNSDISTVFNVNNYTYNGVISTNLGGISAGTANNRLFCVKSNSQEEVGTLYYYNNIYDVRFKNGTKLPKRIVFIDGLLGHANAMAVDDNYVYVTMYQLNGTEKSSIIRISRRAITYLNDGDVVSKTRKTVRDTDGNVIQIYTVFMPKTTSGADYTKSIGSITRYAYNKTAGITKFIIGYPNGKSKLGFTIATLSENGFEVSTSKDDLFYVNNPIYKNNPDVIMQDIFYDSQYGLFISMWLPSGTQNYVLRADIRGLKTQGKTENLVLNPIQVISINKTADQNGTLNKFEIESMAFIKRDENKNDIAFRFVFSCNKVPDGSTSRDSIEELVGFSNKVPKL